jgi:hypothetical protein
VAELHLAELCGRLCRPPRGRAHAAGSAGGRAYRSEHQGSWRRVSDRQRETELGLILAQRSLEVGQISLHLLKLLGSDHRPELCCDDVQLDLA